MTINASLLVAASSDVVHKHLNREIVAAWREATKERREFTIALSGGSLPSLLSTLKATFQEEGEDPNFDAWHVLLADERCVPCTDPDSNLGALRVHFLQHVSIPIGQVYSINESRMNDSTEAVASEYETVLTTVLEKTSQGKIDLAVLGFGPDGHTCSLFPGHALLHESTKLVAAIDDSPKPPPKRITLTLPVLNDMTRRVIFCGVGDSKRPILENVFGTVSDGTVVEDGMRYATTMAAPPRFPCAMVGSDSNTVTWVVDAEAAAGVRIASSAS
jgi:6-phosphogluconolactonase